MEAQREAPFQAALTAAGAAPLLLAETTGFQYNGGKRLSLRLYGRQDDAALATCAPRDEG